MRTEVFRIGFVPDTLGGPEVVANFTTDLIALFSIIEVKEVGGSIAVFATTMNRNGKPAATPDWLQRFSGTFFKFVFEFTPVGLRRNRRPRRRTRWNDIDAKLAIVFGLRFRFELESGFRTGKNFEEQRNDRREFIGGKLAAKPLGQLLK